MRTATSPFERTWERWRLMAEPLPPMDEQERCAWEESLLSAFAAGVDALAVQVLLATAQTQGGAKEVNAHGRTIHGA